MEIQKVEELLVDLEKKILNLVQEFNHITGTVASIDVAYIRMETIGSHRPTCVPRVTASAKIL